MNYYYRPTASLHGPVPESIGSAGLGIALGVAVIAIPVLILGFGRRGFEDVINRQSITAAATLIGGGTLLYQLSK